MLQGAETRPWPLRQLQNTPGRQVHAQTLKIMGTKTSDYLFVSVQEEIDSKTTSDIFDTLGIICSQKYRSKYKISCILFIPGKKATHSTLFHLHLHSTAAGPAG